MKEYNIDTSKGLIHYWLSDNIDSEAITLVFLPGLPAMAGINTVSIEGSSCSLDNKGRC